MENKALISVIMPAFNASTYIQESIESVLAQTFCNWELFIIDDGSTDNTAAIVQNYILKDNRIRYFYQENGKQGKARNLGISNSKANYIAFLDADDLWVTEKLEQQLIEIVDNNVDLVFSDSYIFTDQNSFDKSVKMNTITSFLKRETHLDILLKGNKVPILTVLVKRDKINLVNGFSEKEIIQNAEDYHLWLKLLLAGCVFYGSNETYASYRFHQTSTTANDKRASLQIPAVLFDIEKQFPKYKPFLKKAFKNYFRIKYKTNLFSKTELKNTIDDNYYYLEKSNTILFYKTLNFFLPTKITKRFLIYLLNT